ncbi:MAG TPA: hypothetical protein GXZ77_05660 [Papillibacter sp.]|jgi:hypothetical protein|nr:hypothetical protein [Papillibacter sp.]
MYTSGGRSSEKDKNSLNTDEMGERSMRRGKSVADFCVLTGGDSALVAALSDRLPQGVEKPAFVLHAAEKSEDVVGSPDVLLVSPGCTAADLTAPVTCGTLIFPGDAQLPASQFRADCVVTYGMSPRNTVTYSSIAEDSCVVAVQREIKSFGGRKVESQELRVPGGLHPDTLLAVSAAALVLGV